MLTFLLRSTQFFTLNSKANTLLPVLYKLQFFFLQLKNKKRLEVNLKINKFLKGCKIIT